MNTALLSRDNPPGDESVPLPELVHKLLYAPQEDEGEFTLEMSWRIINLPADQFQLISDELHEQMKQIPSFERTYDDINARLRGLGLVGAIDVRIKERLDSGFTKSDDGSWVDTK